MRPILVVSFVLVSSLTFSAQLANQKPRAERVQDQPKPAAPAPQPPINVTVNVPEPDPQIAKSEAEDRAANLQIQTLIGLATIGIALITALQMVFGILTWKTASKSATAAKDSAEAAKESVKVAKDSVATARSQMAFTISQKRIADHQLRLHRQQMALENRGYLQVGGWGSPSLHDHQSNFSYALSNTGKTHITVERGEMRFSVDRPVTFREKIAIPPQTIGPYEKGAPMAAPIATFGPVPPEVRAELGHPDVILYLGGDVWYRDAFPGTPLHHKRFGVRRMAGQWYPNPAVPNDEIDDERQ